MPKTKIVNGVPVEMSAAEEAAFDAEQLAWETNEKPVLERKRAFRKALEIATDFDVDEINILGHVYEEIQRYRMDQTIATPGINALAAVFPGQTKLQIAVKIENRFQNYLTAGATALGNKIKDELS